MTRYSKNLGAFADVKRVFDTALANGAVVYELPNYSKAIAWRSRAYAYRRLLTAQHERQLAGTNVAPSTPYDTIFITLNKDDKFVTVYAERPAGIMKDLDGNVINPATPQRVEIAADPMLEEAERLAREAGIEI